MVIHVRLQPALGTQVPAACPDLLHSAVTCLEPRSGALPSSLSMSFFTSVQKIIGERQPFQIVHVIRASTQVRPGVINDGDTCSRRYPRGRAVVCAHSQHARSTVRGMPLEFLKTSISLPRYMYIDLCDRISVGPPISSPGPVGGISDDWLPIDCRPVATTGR